MNIKLSTGKASSLGELSGRHSSTHAQGSLPLILWWLLLFSRSVLSDSLWPHGLQHTKLPCPSPSPRVCSNSCPLSRCHPTISSSIALFCPQSLPALGCFPVSWLFTSRDQSIGLHLQPQSFQWIFRVDFLQPGLILLSKVDSLPLSYLGSPSR